MINTILETVYMVIILQDIKFLCGVNIVFDYNTDSVSSCRCKDNIL